MNGYTFLTGVNKWQETMLIEAAEETKEEAAEEEAEEEAQEACRALGLATCRALPPQAAA